MGNESGKEASAPPSTYVKKKKRQYNSQRNAHHLVDTRSGEGSGLSLPNPKSTKYTAPKARKKKKAPPPPPNKGQPKVTTGLSGGSGVEHKIDIRRGESHGMLVPQTHTSKIKKTGQKKPKYDYVDYGILEGDRKRHKQQKKDDGMPEEQFKQFINSYSGKLNALHIGDHIGDYKPQKTNSSAVDYSSVTGKTKEESPKESTQIKISAAKRNPEAGSTENESETKRAPPPPGKDKRAPPPPSKGGTKRATKVRTGRGRAPPPPAKHSKPQIDKRYGEAGGMMPPGFD